MTRFLIARTNGASSSFTDVKVGKRGRWWLVTACRCARIEHSHLPIDGSHENADKGILALTIRLFIFARDQDVLGNKRAARLVSGDRAVQDGHAEKCPTFIRCTTKRLEILRGKPIVFVHGGPGGGTDPRDRRFFDPKAYRIVLYHQRGAGHSTPSASLEQNTTWDLVDDLEKLRQLCGIDAWIIFGGSWGSTLALAYAETHPDRVKALILRGIFLCRRKELLWFYQEGASMIFPDAWDKYLEPIPLAERGDLMSALPSPFDWQRRAGDAACGHGLVRLGDGNGTFVRGSILHRSCRR